MPDFSPIKVRVRFFASIREVLGDGETVELEAPVNVGQLRDRLIDSGPDAARVLSRQRALRTAVNQILSEESAPLQDGAEVAFFPPVTGG